ncbi:unnamed protein product [Closterium sp. NIES-54]
MPLPTFYSLCPYRPFTLYALTDLLLSMPLPTFYSLCPHRPFTLPFSLSSPHTLPFLTWQERTYAIRKAHVNVDKALKAAEVVLEKYDVARQVR